MPPGMLTLYVTLMSACGLVRVCCAIANEAATKRLAITMVSDNFGLC
jgi:hypothetical protein